MSLKDLFVATFKVMIAARREGVRCLEDCGRCLNLLTLALEACFEVETEEADFCLEALDLVPRDLVFGGFVFGFGVAGVGAGTGTACAFAATASWFETCPSWVPWKGGPGGCGRY